MSPRESAVSKVQIGVDLSELILCSESNVLDSHIENVVASLFDGLDVSYTRLPATIPDQVAVSPVTAEDCYLLASKGRTINESDLQKLNQIAALTARLLLSRENLDVKLKAALKSQVLHSQILDRIQESVITMDLAGFILSWNLGAEKLFGYSSAEAVGQNILFLYEDADDISLAQEDFFSSNGGHEMEVRRRKKNGDIFWASLSLSTLFDEFGNAIGLLGYISDITQRKCAEEKINHLAYYDALTDFPNRTLFKKLVDAAIQRSLRSENGGGVLFIDLNRFKPINEALGHAVGDELLEQVASRFRAVIRENDVFARLGGDEFAVAVVDVKQHFDVGLVAQKLLGCLDQTFYIDQHELKLGASIGISLFPQDGLDAEDLLQKADIAMFRAKRLLEKSCGDYAFYDAEMNHLVSGRMQLESSLRRALELNEFFLLFQPKVDIITGKVLGAEALIRWAKPGQGIISPADFIPIAEESNLIVQIDSWVLDAACQQAKRWQDCGLEPFRIAVNVSAKEFTDTLCERVQICLEKYGLSSAWIELEITESMLMRNATSVVSIMNQLTALGVRLALDDFGTGFSSLSYLKKFPIDSVKIDRSFVQGVPDDIDDCAISSAIISMAKQMRHRVVAEGVENNEQFNFLRKMGCDEIQGYLFARPLDVEKFTDALRNGFNLPYST